MKKKFLSLLSFWVFLFGVATFLGALTITYAFDGPSGDPPGGSEAAINVLDGNVGIGITNPTGKFTVISGVASSGAGRSLYLQAGTGASLNPGGSVVIGAGQNGVDSTNGNIIFGIANSDSEGLQTEFVRIADSGKVGIGTNDPDTTLHINSPANLLSVTAQRVHDGDIVGITIANGKVVGSGTNQGVALRLINDIGGNSRSVGAISSFHEAGNLDTSVLAFYTHTSAEDLAERMRITQGGNVGIGTMSPGALLDLSSPFQNTGRILLSGQEFYQAGNSATSGVAIQLGVNRGGNRQIWFSDSEASLNSINAAFRVRTGLEYASIGGVSTDGTTVRDLVIQEAGGNVGIGTSTPNTNAKLDTNGNIMLSADNPRLYLYPPDLNYFIGRSGTTVQVNSSGGLSLDATSTFNLTTTGGNLSLNATNGTLTLNGATISAGGKRIQVLADPQSPSDAATRGWVEANSGSSTLLVTSTLAGTGYTAFNMPNKCLNSPCDITIIAKLSDPISQIHHKTGTYYQTTNNKLGFKETSVTSTSIGTNGNTSSDMAMNISGCYLKDDETAEGGEINPTQWTLQDASTGEVCEVWIR